MQTFTLLLCLVPDVQPFPAGEWLAEWGSLKQGMSFFPDGTYFSAEHGSGFWSSDFDGRIWFSERDDDP